MTASAGRLEGKVAVVTGAGSGIGQAMAKLFAQEGAHVAAIALHDASLQKWDKVPNVLPIRADITQLSEINRMMDQAERRLGRVDIVCNVAGIHDANYPLDETTDERWEGVMSLDLRAPFQICRRAIKGMMQRESGVILNVGSAYASLRGNHGPCYTAAKYGLTGLSLSIAVRYAGKGIRCNVILPGPVYTEIMRNSGDVHPDGVKVVYDLIAAFPGKAACQPEEIAPMALFLCSDEARHVNGAVIAVDGGMSAC